MGVLLVLTSTGRASDVLPALALLGHTTRVAPMDGAALVETGPADVILVDARRDLVNARPFAVRWAVYYGVILAIMCFGMFGESQFIYFQF